MGLVAEFLALCGPKLIRRHARVLLEGASAPHFVGFHVHLRQHVIENAKHTAEGLSEKILLEDYKLWQRELEKQDRWFAQSIWTVLAGSAAGLMLIRPLKPAERPIAECILTGVAGLFVSMSADFLVGRIATYLKVARFVAAVRAASKSIEQLRINPIFQTPGAPLISDNPSAYVRTSAAGSRSPFRALYKMHWIVLALLYGMLAPILFYDLQSFAWGAGCFALGAVHLLLFDLLFKWRASEADNWGEFVVTLARDYRVGVARDGESRLIGWMKRAPNVPAILRDAHIVVPLLVEWEDRRFWRHRGVDWTSVASVLIRRRRRGGASTIPMQLARQLIANPHGGSRWYTLKRKVFEALLGRWLVARLGHEFVLATWLQQIPYGHATVRGIERAADIYLGKAVAELDVLDALLIAERISISSGRFSEQRLRRVFSWAAIKKFVPPALEVEAVERFRAMQCRWQQHRTTKAV